jgi:hypothetical protein
MFFIHFFSLESRCYTFIHFLLSGFDDGSPDGNDPLVLARQMAARGITLVPYSLVSHIVKRPSF